MAAWFETTTSRSGSRHEITPTASASWPMHVCVVPCSSPAANSSSSVSSNRRISAIRS